MTGVRLPLLKALMPWNLRIFDVVGTKLTQAMKARTRDPSYRLSVGQHISHCQL
jgi:hypothetical protein